MDFESRHKMFVANENTHDILNSFDVSCHLDNIVFCNRRYLLAPLTLTASVDALPWSTQNPCIDNEKPHDILNSFDGSCHLDCIILHNLLYLLNGVSLKVVFCYLDLLFEYKKLKFLISLKRYELAKKCLL